MSDVVEYDQLVAFLKHASLFEIYRLSVAIENELDNPERLPPLIKKIKVGDVVEYFESQTNQFIRATVLEKRLKKVLVKNIEDQKRWILPYHMLNIDSRAFVFAKKEHGLDKNTIKVGDFVGFYHEKMAEDITGRVERLNQKTVTILTASKHQWRVPYSHLYPIIDGEQADVCLGIEYESQ
jgi:uncharacterized protein YkvS